MSNVKKDLYSQLAFFQAMVPTTLAAAAVTGLTIDTIGYDCAVMVVNFGPVTSAGAIAAGSCWQLKLEHAVVNAAGTGASDWSEVYPSQMIHSVLGMAGAYSALNSGIFQSITSYTDLSVTTGTGNTGKAFIVGYKGPRRFIRLVVSVVGAPSIASVSAMCVLGGPQIWPVNAAVGD
jgi:hypothetical protein